MFFYSYLKDILILINIKIDLKIYFMKKSLKIWQQMYKK